MKVIYNYAAAPQFAASLGELRSRGLDVDVCPESDDTRLFELLASAEVLWHCLRPVDRRVMDAAPNLKLIQKIGVGVNTIDLDYAKARGIAVCNMPGTNSAAVAEHTLALALAVLRLLRPFDAEVRGGVGWAWPPQRQDRLGEIRGRTVGLIGFGAVPRLLAPILSAMGAQVVYSAQSRKPDIDLPYVPLDALLAMSDIVSLHIPLTPATTKLMNRTRLRTMRSGSILINTARGALIDDTALIEALDHGPLVGAGLDVFTDEPTPRDHPLFGRNDVVLTPHVAWLTRETLARSVGVAADNCLRLANAQPLRFRVV